MHRIASRRVVVPLMLLLGLAAPELTAQEFPEGELGTLYYAPRIDLLSEEQGGPREVELDGELDESVWEAAAWHGWVHDLSAVGGIPRGDPQPPDFEALSEEEDLSFEWAALADSEYLYVAWRIGDDVRRNEEETQCNVWQDDSVEIYIDALNDGPDCTSDSTARCYGFDDTQVTVGLENVFLQNGDPDQLIFGGVGPGGQCDFSGPHPEVARGMVREVFDEEDAYAGWQAEIAIALETFGNFDDGSPEWAIDPGHGEVIGFNMHGQDDDDGEGRDHKLIWSEAEAQESSWRNPGVFAKLMFVDPTKPPPPLVLPVTEVSCARDPETGGVTVTWTNPEDVDPALPIAITVDGEEVRELEGGTTSVELTTDEIPLDDRDHTVGVVNASGVPVECVVIGSPFDACGAIRGWNILGAFDNPGGAAPAAEDMALDYMTDGDAGETDFAWRPGAEIETDFGGAAASTSIDGGPAGRNPGGVPTVFARRGESGRVFFQGPDVFGGDLDQVMAYAQTYVVAEEETEAFLGVASDDSIQVLLNGEEVFLRSIGRGGADPCSAAFPQDVPFDPVVLDPGPNSLVVKVFEGSVDWDFALRFQDAIGEPVTEGLTTRLEPEPEEPPAPAFVRGDADANGTINITDGVFVLNFLFTGGTEPSCTDAADADDNGAINITDGVFILNFLFTGGDDPPAPGLECGEDPTGDELDCATAHPGCAG